MRHPLQALVLIAFAALLTQGFQCASSDVAVARKAISQQDFVKAKTALDKAIATNPADCEALVLMADVSQKLNDADAMIEFYKKADTCKNLKPDQRTELSIKMYNVWVSQYNGAITKFNDYVSSKNSDDLVQSASYADNALGLKPTFSEPALILGQVREVEGDTNQMIKAYQMWWEIEKPGFDLMIQKSIALSDSRGQLIKVFGTPIQSKVDTISDGSGTIKKDLFDFGGRSLYTFCYDDGKGADAVFEGWTYNPLETLSEYEKWRTRTTSVLPLKGLAFAYYQSGQSNTALEYTTIVTSVKPTDQELWPLRAQLLQNVGKSDEALKDIQTLVEKNPNNTTYRLQYANLLSGNNDEQGALKQYSIVLKTEPDNETALYNLAAMYKNIAVEKQRSELEKMDKNKKYQPSMSYNDDLKTAADYFEKLRKSFKYADDLVVLEQLANIYEVRKEVSKVKGLIMELEALETKYSKSKEYYRVMEGLYGRNNMLDKMKQAAEKGSKL